MILRDRRRGRKADPDSGYVHRIKRQRCESADGTVVIVGRRAAVRIYRRTEFRDPITIISGRTARSLEKRA